MIIFSFSVYVSFFFFDSSFRFRCVCVSDMVMDSQFSDDFYVLKDSN